MESKIVELETLTPLFIKGKDLDYGEGVLKGNDGVVYLIDNDKLCEYIASKNKTEEYVNYFSASDGTDRRFFSIDDFLHQEMIFPDQAKIKGLAYGVTQLSQGKKFVQNGKGANFIPGSSLKGAIRNAVLWRILSEPTKNTMFGSFIRYHISLVEKMSNLSDLINDRRFEDAKVKVNHDHVLRQAQLIQRGRLNVKKFKEFKENYEEHLSKQQDSKQNTIDSISFLGNIPLVIIEKPFDDKYKKYLQEYNKRWEKANDTLRDFFRLVKISDGNFIQDFELEGQTAKAVCKDTSGDPYKNYTYQKKFPIKLECTSKAVRAHFKITIDTELAKAFFPKGIPSYLQSVKGLIKVVDEFYREVARFEKDEFYDKSVSIPNDIYPHDNKRAKLKVNTSKVLELYKTTFGLGPGEILFRTGWGGGYMSKTQFLHLTVNTRATIRNLSNDRGSQIAPKSRCLIVEDDQAKEPIGWCKLKIIGDAKNIKLPGVNTATIKSNFLTEQQGVKKNRKSHISEKKNQQFKAKSNEILKKAEKNKSTTLHKAYKEGERVNAVVVSSKPLQSVTVKINEHTLVIRQNVMKQNGEEVTLIITKMENDKIIEAKLI